MKWINTKYKLPENLQKVLFTWETDSFLKNISMGFMQDNEWRIYLPYTSFALNETYIKITHWAELPKYPK